MNDPRLDQHLVAHDVASLVMGGAFGALAALISGSMGVGAATALFLSALGIALMRVGAVRQAVNRFDPAAKGGDRHLQEEGRR